MLFNLPATHSFKLDRLGFGLESNIVTIPARIKGASLHPRTQQRLTEAEQVQRICKFWMFLLTQDDGTPQPINWQYVIPGYTAYFFWANALLSRYCDFWGMD